MQRSKLSQREGRVEELAGGYLSVGQGHPHVQSQSLIEQQQEDFIEFQQNLGSDGDELISSQNRGLVKSQNSNESVPVRSAHEHASQQSYSYDFLYDPEVAKRGSSASHKLSSNNSLAAQSAALSPHVFRLSTDEAQQNNRSGSATAHGPNGNGGSGSGAQERGRLSGLSAGSRGHNPVSKYA